MKTNTLNFIATIALLFLFTGIQYSCSSTGAASTTTPQSDFAFNSILDMLRREPQLNISGSDSNPSIRIRGNRSIEGNNEPLFVVDGTPLGYGYSSVSSIDVNQVQSINVLPASQAGLYGARGGTGVIQIRTK